MNINYDRVLIVSCIIFVTFRIYFPKYIYLTSLYANVDIYVRDIDIFDCTGLRNEVARVGCLFGKELFLGVDGSSVSSEI
jgi:hypothetical protein